MIATLFIGGPLHGQRRHVGNATYVGMAYDLLEKPELGPAWDSAPDDMLPPPKIHRYFCADISWQETEDRTVTHRVWLSKTVTGSSPVGLVQDALQQERLNETIKALRGEEQP